MSARAVATVGRRRFREEIFYDAQIVLQGRTVFRLEDRPSAQSVCLDVLEWADRQGKEIEWQYKNLTL